MSLSCSCDCYDYDFEAGDWIYSGNRAADFEKLATSKRKRCCSCNELINIGSLCLIYARNRYPHDEIESQIKSGRDLDDSFCDEPSIKIADHYHCEKCAEIWLNLTEIGYECLAPCENIVESLREYHELIRFKEIKQENKS